MDDATITAAEFLAAAEKSEGNGFFKQEFSQLVAKLEKRPQTKQRLVFEMLLIAWKSLEVKVDPAAAVLWAALWSDSIEASRLIEYVDWLERIIFRYFDMLGLLKESAIHPYAMTLSLALTGIRKVSPPRSSAAFDALRRKCGESKLDPRRELINKVEQVVFQGEK